jgi:hypothetical protein
MLRMMNLFFYRKTKIVVSIKRPEISEGRRLPHRCLPSQ